MKLFRAAVFFTLLAPLAYLLMSVSALAQDQPTTLHEFSLSPILPRRLQILSWPHQAQNGFYLQTGETSVVWDSLDGAKSVTFNLSNAPGSTVQDPPWLVDYTGLPFGGFAALLQWAHNGDTTRWSIAEFRSDGTYERSIALKDLNINPFRFAVFGSGDIFLEGGERTSGMGIAKIEEIILDSMGTLKARVDGPSIGTPPTNGSQDNQTKDTGSQNQSEEEKLFAMMHGDTQPTPEENNQRIAERAVLSAGDDGYIYAYWPAIPDTLQKISQTGNIATLYLPKNEPGDLLSFMERNGEIALVRARRQPDKIPGASKVLSMTLTTYNPADPSIATRHSLSTSTIPVLLSFGSNDFYFIKMIKNDPSGLFFIVRMTP